jgi:hypothetical protein
LKTLISPKFSLKKEVNSLKIHQFLIFKKNFSFLFKKEEENGKNKIFPQKSFDYYCYLKEVDIEYIIEILKILFNLTIDANKADKLMSDTTGPKIIELNDRQVELEEEAHYMHLVSVLRDLLTCKQETTSRKTSKIDDMHSNIINLLTNMPSICFEELLTPSFSDDNDNSDKKGDNSQKDISTETLTSLNHLNVRSRYNEQRLSHRSRKRRNEATELSSTSTSVVATSNIDDDSLINNDDIIEFEGKNMEAICLILNFCQRQMRIYLKQETPDTMVTVSLHPVLMLLVLMSMANKCIRRYCRMVVLPQLNSKDLHELPQSGVKMRNQLCKLMTDPDLQIKRLSAQFLFILCKENVSRLCKYTGFGNAAGLLAELGLMGSNSGQTNTEYSTSSSSSNDDNSSDEENNKTAATKATTTTNNAEIKKLMMQVNPITGRIDKQPKYDPFEGMTDEQKEYEALQLVNTIDRLSKLEGGLIKPATIGPDGKPVPVQHVLQLQQNIKDNVDKK